MIKAIIFDFDGVLVNTEKIHIDIETSIVREYNQNFIHELKRYAGMKELEFWQMMCKENNIPVDPVDLLNRSHAMHKEAFGKGLVFEESISLLKKLQKEHALALATGATRELLNMTVKDSDLLKYFKAIITSDDVQKGKPDPETFLMAAQSINCAPQDCIVVEDAPNGIAAAKAAGMKVIAITSTFDKEFLGLADAIVEHLHEIPQAIQQLGE